MTDLAQTIAKPADHVTFRCGLWARARTHLAQIKSAHARQAQFVQLGHNNNEIARDVGLPDEVFMGKPVYDPALPFFFQRNFDP